MSLSETFSTCCTRDGITLVVEGTRETEVREAHLKLESQAPCRQLRSQLLLEADFITFPFSPSLQSTFFQSVLRWRSFIWIKSVVVNYSNERSADDTAEDTLWRTRNAWNWLWRESGKNETVQDGANDDQPRTFAESTQESSSEKYSTLITATRRLVYADLSAVPCSRLKEDATENEETYEVCRRVSWFVLAVLRFC